MAKQDQTENATPQGGCVAGIGGDHGDSGDIMTESESGKLKYLCGKIAQTIPGGDARLGLELLGKFVDTQYNEIKKLQARVNKLEDKARGAAGNASP